MKFIKNILLITAFSLPFFSSCNTEQKDLDVDNSMIELSEESVIAGPEGGEFSVTVNSSQDWQIAGFSEWISFASETGKAGSALKMNILPNTGKEILTAEVKVFSGSATATLTITSNPNMYVELAKEETLNISSGESSFTIGVRTNCPDLEISYSDGADKWISNTNKIEGFSGKTMYEFTALKTDLFKARDAKIFFKVKGTENSVSADLIQAQLDTAIVVEGPKIIKGLEAVDFEMNVRSNVDFKYQLPAWVEEVSKNTGEKDETGLATTTFKLHCDKTAGSRGKVVEFMYLNSNYDNIHLGEVMIKQQNPNPVFCIIPDPVLRNILIGQEWVLPEDESIGKCEIIALGMEGTKLSITGKSSWDELDIKSLDGLEVFPKLNELYMTNCLFEDVDLSKMTNLTYVKMTNCSKVATCKLGSIPVKNLDIINDDYGHQAMETIVVSGENVENLDMHSFSYYIRYYEKLKTLDVTGLPNLKTLKAKRGIPNWDNTISPATTFKTIIMTAQQKSTVSVDKFDTVSIEVK